MIDTSERPAKVTRSHQEVYSQELGLQSLIYYQHGFLLVANDTGNYRLLEHQPVVGSGTDSISFFLYLSIFFSNYDYLFIYLFI